MFSRWPMPYVRHGQLDSWHIYFKFFYIRYIQKLYNKPYSIYNLEGPVIDSKISWPSDNISIGNDFYFRNSINPKSTSDRIDTGAFKLFFHHSYEKPGLHVPNPARLLSIKPWICSHMYRYICGTLQRRSEHPTHWRRVAQDLETFIWKCDVKRMNQNLI